MIDAIVDEIIQSANVTNLIRKDAGTWVIIVNNFTELMRLQTVPIVFVKDDSKKQEYNLKKEALLEIRIISSVSTNNSIFKNAKIIKNDNKLAFEFKKKNNCETVCNFCHQLGDLKKCAGCNDAKYCSQDCQRRDWQVRHMNECSHVLEIKQEAETAQSVL